MKLLIFSFLLFVINFSFSQTKIDSNLLVSDFGGKYVAIKLFVPNLNISKKNNVDANIDSLYSKQYRKVRKHIFYYYFNLHNKEALYRIKRYCTNAGYIRKIDLSDNKITFEYLIKGGKVRTATISYNNDNCYSLIMTKINKRGKVKTYFTKDCTLVKYSV